MKEDKELNHLQNLKSETSILLVSCLAYVVLGEETRSRSLQPSMIRKTLQTLEIRKMGGGVGIIF